MAISKQMSLDHGNWWCMEKEVSWKVLLSDYLYPVMKHFYPEGSGLFQDDSTPIPLNEGSLNGGLTEITHIIYYVLHNNQVVALSWVWNLGVLHHHHQNTKWWNTFWKNGSPVQFQVVCLRSSTTLLIYFMLIFTLNCSPFFDIGFKSL